MVMVSPSLFLFTIRLEIGTNEIRQENEIIYSYSGEIKLFTANMIVNVENPSVSTTQDF